MNRFNSVKTFALFGVSIFSFISSNAQSHVSDLIKKLMPQPVPASPNVAALGKYGDYQVSYFTGLPDISIPVFEAKSRDLSISYRYGDPDPGGSRRIFAERRSDLNIKTHGKANLYSALE